MFKGLKTQLLQEAKASWKKAVSLGALTCVLIVVCMVQFGGSSKPASASRKPPTPAPQTKPVVPIASAPAPIVPVVTNQTNKPTTEGFDWKSAEEMFKTHPLVQPVAATSIRTDPFRVDFGQFSPPIAFVDGNTAVEEDDRQEASDIPKIEQLAVPQGMELKSTIIGASRRNALINRKLYEVGSDIRVESDGGDKTYTVMAISPRKVILVCDTIMYELKIASRRKNIEIQRITTE